MMNADSIYVGIDVSKSSLDVCVGVGGQLSTLSNDESGHDSLCALLRQHCVHLVLLEATGGYEFNAAAALQAARFAVPARPKNSAFRSPCPP
jgi:transposase